MTSLPASIAASMPSDNEMVIGTVTSVNPLTVAVRGGTVYAPGLLNSYIPNLNEVVVLMREGATWLVLGASTSATAGAVPIINVNTAGTVQSTASPTYVNVTNFRATGFTKRLSSTQLRVDFSVSMWLSVAGGTSIQWGLDCLAMSGGATQRVDMMTGTVDPVLQHQFMSCHLLIPNLVAGTYDLQVLWRVVSGGGTLRRDTNDWSSILVTEVN